MAKNGIINKLGVSTIRNSSVKPGKKIKNTNHENGIWTDFNEEKSVIF